MPQSGGRRLAAVVAILVLSHVVVILVATLLGPIHIGGPGPETLPPLTPRT